MSKIFFLTRNEFIRNIKRVSTFVVIILTVVVVFGFGALAQFSINRQTHNQRVNTITNPDNKTAMSQQISYLQTQVSTASSAADKAVAQSEYNILNAAYQKGIYVAISSIPGATVEFTPPQTYQEVAVSDAVDAMKSAVGSQVAAYNTISADYLDAALTSNYSELISTDNSFFVQNSGLAESDPTNQAYIYANSLRQKYDVTYLDNPSAGTANDLIVDIYNNKVGLIQGVSPSTGSVLTGSDITNVNNDIKIDLYKLDHKIVTAENANVTTKSMSSMIPPNLVGLGIVIVSILMAILAGASIAQEIATGAIKGLIIAPVKRWQILLSKFLSITVLAILLDLLVYLVATVTTLVFYGSNIDGYFSVIGGSVTVIPFFLYLFFVTLLKIPELIIFIILALMLSTLTRNTAISISITVAFGLIGNAVVTVLATFFKGDWLKFMPFQHFSDLSSKVFPTVKETFGRHISVNGSSPSIPVTSLTFSIVYLCVVFILMYLTAHESFIKKDI